MKRTTVNLPDDLVSALQREAKRRDVSVSEIAREAFSAHLGLTGEDARPIPFAALGSSGRTSTGRDIEKLLKREWGRARSR